MVNLRAAMRVMPAFWFALPILMLAGWYVTALYPSDGYGLGATALGSGALTFVAAFSAGTAAWEGARLRRSRVWWAPSVRSRVAIAAWSILPSVLIGFVALVGAVGVQLARSGADMPDLRILAVSALDLVAWGVVGFTIGIMLPVAAAVPLALLLPLIWFAFVPAFYPVWLRHLTGMFRDCCGLGQDLAPAAIAASAVVDLGIIVAAAILVGGMLAGWRRAAGAAGSIAAALLVGIALVSNMTYAPVVARDPALLTCRTADGLTLCLWPEHAARGDDLSRIAGTVRRGWQQAGLDAPTLFTEADQSVAPAGALAFVLSGPQTTDDVIRDLVAALVPTPPECPLGSTGLVAIGYLGGWYAAAGGMSEGGLKEKYGGWSDGNNPDVEPTIDSLRAASPQARLRWIENAKYLIATCDDVVPDLTVAP